MAIEPAVDTSALATQLERRVTRLTRMLRAHTQSPSRSSVAAVMTLSRLDLEGPLRITDLAATELVAQPTMTGIVRRLEHDGLVARTPDPLDARAARIALTDAGREELASVRRSRAAVLQERLDRLDDDARTALAAALDPLDALSQ
jgi:DNA-binding MarR family transcriptional regulator